MKFKFIILFIFLPLLNFGQGIELPQAIPPSPMMREYDKYITHNVSISNGIPEINVPLYEIKLKGMTIPISLSYHASGIKFKQTSGEVGVGWILNPKYHISKTIYGRDDKKEEVPVSPLLEPYSAFNEITSRDRYLAGFINSNFIYPMASEKRDGEYDIFNFSLYKDNGSFILKDRYLMQYEFLENQQIKINHHPVYESPYFDVIDEDGVKYRLGGESFNTKAMETMGGGGLNVPSGFGWFVTKINTPAQQQVQFEYINRVSAADQNHILNATVMDGLGESLHEHESTTYNYSNPGTPQQH